MTLQPKQKVTLKKNVPEIRIFNNLHKVQLIQEPYVGSHTIMQYVFLPLSFQNSCCDRCVLRHVNTIQYNAIQVVAAVFIDFEIELPIHQKPYEALTELDNPFESLLLLNTSNGLYAAMRLLLQTVYCCNGNG